MKKIFTGCLMVLFLAGFMAGCGHWNGSDGSAAPAPGAGVIIPGATCTTAGPTIPTVTASDPTSGNQLVTTSTTGVAGGGKLITATFSLAMDATTINATSFTLTPAGGVALTPASVSYNAGTKVATLTTSAALLANTTYTAAIAITVTSATGTPIACRYEWTFKTTATPSTSSVNLGRAATYGMAATAGVTNTPTVPITHIEGDVVLTTTPTCNGVDVLFADGPGFGLCGGSPPTINGTVITPLYPDTTTATGVLTDLRAAYIFLSPANMPGATAIAAGTTMGAVTGSAEVVGDNLFYPGVYQSITTILITGDLILDGQDDSNATFVFQSSGAIGAAADPLHTRILLRNGAKASNVWWWNGSNAVTLGVGAEWQGNILSYSDVTMETGATSCGRIFAGASTDGLFVFDSNVVSVPGQPFAPAQPGDVIVRSTTCE